MEDAETQLTTGLDGVEWIEPDPVSWGGLLE